MPVIVFEGRRPTVADDAFVAPTATLIGNVTLERQSSVWFGAVLRGDLSRIVIRAGSCVQDNAVIHCADDLPTIVGRSVVVGHSAMGSLIAAGSVVGEGQVIPPGVLAAGVPAVVKKELEGSAAWWVEHAAAHYRRLRQRYAHGGEP
jgi:carbonic anhydrase/acetyltransferase-like protein (isoleucine patch superfamily)